MVAVTPGHFVLLALDRENVVGHVMATHVGKNAVEIGLMVAEAYQYRGVGRKLVHELAKVLAAQGLTQVCCDVLSENRLVLGWMRRVLLDIRIERNGTTVTVHGTLPARVSPKATNPAWTDLA
jgi:ribosomal protein S18 acetylase RimI-like enzyme